MNLRTIHDPVVVAAFDIMGVKRLARTTDGSCVAAEAIANLWGNLLIGQDAYPSAALKGDSFPLYRLSDHFSDSAYVYGHPTRTLRLQADSLALRAAASLAIAVCHPKRSYALRCGIGAGSLVEQPIGNGLEGHVRIGSAMAAAYAIETSQQWLGGAIADELAAGMRPTPNIIAYAVPAKPGCPPLRYAINWVTIAMSESFAFAAPSIDELKNRVVSAFETAGSLQVSEKAKLSNTLSFIDHVWDGGVHT